MDRPHRRSPLGGFLQQAVTLLFHLSPLLIFSRLATHWFFNSCYVASVSSASPPEQTWKLHCAVNQSAKNSSRPQPDRSDQWEGREFVGPMRGREVDNKIWRSSDQTRGPRRALGRSTAGSLLHRRPLANLTKQDNPPALLAKLCRNV